MALALDADRDELHFPSLPQIISGLIVGVGFIAFNFPIGLEKLGNVIGWPIVRNLGATAESNIVSISGATPAAQILSFDSLWSKLILVVLAYLAALLLLSLRHLRFDLFGFGFTSLAVGAGSLHLLAWAIFLLFGLLVIVLGILGWILHILGVVLLWVFQALAAVFGFIWMIVGNFIAFLIASGWWAIAALLLVVLLIVLAVRNREALLEFLRTLMGTALFTGLFVGVTFLLIKLWEFLAPLLARLFEFLAPVFAFLGRVFDVLFRITFYLLIGLAVTYIVYGLGSLLLDQFKGAWNSGNGRRGVIIGSLAVGATVSLILVESNLYNAITYFPSAYAGFITTYMHQSSPIIDVLTAILIVAISILGILRNLPQLLREPGIGEFRTSMVMVGLGIGLAVGLAAVATASGQGGSS